MFNKKMQKRCPKGLVTFHIIIFTIIFQLVLIPFLCIESKAQYEYGVEISCDDPNHDVNLTNNSTYYILIVENTGDGNTWEKVEVSAAILNNESVNHWNITLSPEILILNRGEKKCVNLYVKALQNSSKNEYAFVEILAEVVDGSSCRGSASDFTQTNTTLINTKPISNIENISPLKATKGNNLKFKGQSQDLDGNITKYLWKSDLDGIISTLENFSISNLSIGNHTITYKVMDDNFTWSEEVSINVKISESQFINFVKVLIKVVAGLTPLIIGLLIIISLIRKKNKLKK